MDSGAWQAIVHGITKSWTQLSKFHYTKDVHSPLWGHGLQPEVHLQLLRWGLHSAALGASQTHQSTHASN